MTTELKLVRDAEKVHRAVSSEIAVRNENNIHRCRQFDGFEAYAL
jgi:hypothetical protein